MAERKPTRTPHALADTYRHRQFESRTLPSVNHIVLRKLFVDCDFPPRSCSGVRFVYCTFVNCYGTEGLNLEHCDVSTNDGYERMKPDA
jgi:hypothetical protein